jgi:hypothetical protein
MALRFTTSYVEDSTAILDDESNSIAVIVKHMAGNMRSRLTDFLTSDGEIVFLSKHLCHDRWQNLSVPRGASTEFTRRVRAGESSQR